MSKLVLFFSRSFFLFSVFLFLLFFFPRTPRTSSARGDATRAHGCGNRRERH